VILVTVEAVKSLLASAEGELAYLSKDCNQDVKRLLHPFVRSKHSSETSSSSSSSSKSSSLPLNQKRHENESFLQLQHEIQFSNKGNFIEFTSRELWAPDVVSTYGYGHWLRTLTSRLLIDCYYEQEQVLQQQEVENGLSSSGAAAAAAALSSSSSGLLKRNSTKLKPNSTLKGQHEQHKNRQLLSNVHLIGNDVFLKLCLPLCQMRASFAELIFPAIIDDLTSHTSFEARKLIR
jgi:hypothetical protein